MTKDIKQKIILVSIGALTVASITFASLYWKEKQIPKTIVEDESGKYMMHDLVNDLPKADLSQEEKDGLIKMREEEKLARDVYLTLYDKWKEPVFSNIARSEQIHTDSVKALLLKYNLDDPVKNDSVGEFTNPEMKKLYEQLVAQGSKSTIDALKVGATIEDLDIYDLDELLQKTDNEDVKLVYESLRSGSYNHMRAFVRVLRMRNEDYQPQYISKEEFETILNTSNNGGYGQRGGGRWQR